MQRKPQKGAQCRRTKETAAHQIRSDLMYITVDMRYNKLNNKVSIVLIWKTPDDSFKHNVYRYRNNKVIAELRPTQFRYERRGDYLIASIKEGDPDQYPEFWKGVGEWRIEPNIRGNVRGCI